MIIPFINYLTGLGLSQKLAKTLVIVAAVALACAGCVGLKVWYDSRIISHAIQTANVKTLQKEAPANDKAAAARADDTIKLTIKAQERHDLISKTTDQMPTPADLALNCRRLSEAGYDTTTFPSCAGH